MTAAGRADGLGLYGALCRDTATAAIVRRTPATSRACPTCSGAGFLVDKCGIKTAHCEDCGGTEIIVGTQGPECDYCGGNIVNSDQCEGH